MGWKKEQQAALFCKFNLDRHVPDGHVSRQIDRFVDLSDVRRHPQLYATRIDLQAMDFRARKIHTRSDPSNVGTEHLAR